eukprot:5563778-Prymnesium_polylepis.2
MTSDVASRIWTRGDSLESTKLHELRRLPEATPRQIFGASQGDTKTATTHGPMKRAYFDHVAQSPDTDEGRAAKRVWRKSEDLFIAGA